MTNDLELDSCHFFSFYYTECLCGTARPSREVFLSAWHTCWPRWKENKYVRCSIKKDGEFFLACKWNLLQVTFLFLLGTLPLFTFLNSYHIYVLVLNADREQRSPRATEIWRCLRDWNPRIRMFRSRKPFGCHWCWQVKISYSHFCGLRSSVEKYVFVNNSRAFSCFTKIFLENYS